MAQKIATVSDDGRGGFNNSLLTQQSRYNCEIAQTVTICRMDAQPQARQNSESTRKEAQSVTCSQESIGK